MERLARVRESFRLRSELLQASLERELPVDCAELLCQGGDRTPVEVEAAFRVTAGRHEEDRPPGGAVHLVLAEELGGADG